MILLTCQSCVIHNEIKSHENIMCGLHNEKMKKTFVRTIYGKQINPCTNDRYPNAKRKKCMGCVVPIWPAKRIAYTYHCKSCDRLKKEIEK